MVRLWMAQSWRGYFLSRLGGEMHAPPPNQGSLNRAMWITPANRKTTHLQLNVQRRVDACFWGNEGRRWRRCTDRRLSVSSSCSQRGSNMRDKRGGKGDD